MTQGRLAGHVRARRLALGLASFVAAAAFLPASAFAVAPFDGTTVSAGLGPTFSDPWCAPAAPGSSIAGMQGSPLALIPYEAIGCTLAKIQNEATAATIPHRMDYSIIGTSAGGRDMYGVVVNAMETMAQQRDYSRWQQLRAMELTDPAAAQILLDSWGGDVKMPVFIEANIHGDEEEGADAMMQVLRDLVTTPYGVNATVDKILDRTILIVIPNQNPDGRFLGQRANANNFDMNRDFIVQSQAETRTSIKLQQQWLATVGLAMHGYVNPTLIDGLTKPHNPGLEYDLFAYWNQRRLDANQAALAAVGMGITRPVNQYNSSGGGTSGNPATAEGWDDWGPFYTQTYMAFYGPDSSTLEMCSSGAGCTGRFGSKRAQYIGFYSSANYWIDNRQGLMHDQLEIFRRGVADADRPLCCADPLLTLRGFTESQHNWMVPYPKAYVIPFDGGGQRSDGEANRMAKWLLDNGIQVTRMTSDFTWGSTTYPAGSYVVYMNQAMRGLALTVLSAGQDISARITQLYAPPGAWSHGLLWGADVVEIPRGDPTFTPSTAPIAAPNAFTGGVRGGPAAPADWYAVTVGGVSDVKAVYALVKSGVRGQVAEASFTTTTGGTMPAGSLIFTSRPGIAEALDDAGRAAGLWFERSVGLAKPPTSRLAEAPRVAILVNSANPAASDTTESIKAIFGSDAAFVSVLTGTGSIQNAATDPLLAFDVIVNTGQAYPAAANTTARARLNAFFARGGGYVATGQSTTNFSFLTGAVPALVAGSFTQGSSSAGGGITAWNNIIGAASPITGALPSSDYLYMPTNVVYFSAVPTGAVIDGRHNASMVGSSSNGPSPGFVAGLWRNRSSNANNAPVIVHGTTTAGSRYLGLAPNPFSRQDAEREWFLVAQAALWSNLTDEPFAAIAFPVAGSFVNDAGFGAGCPVAGICGTATSSPGPALARVRVALQQVATGLWWNGSAFAAAAPVELDATGTAGWSFPLAAAQLPAEGAYVVRAKAVDVSGNEQIQPEEAMFTVDRTAPVTSASLSPAPVNGWYKDPTVTLAASDGGAGVELTEYRLDGGPWTEYADPFVVTGDGAHSLEYRSLDGAGNLEETTTLPFSIDTTAPAISIAAPADGGVYLLDAVVDADYACSDGGSGVTSCAGPVASGSPFSTSPVAFHGFTVTASDDAGNFSLRTVVYQVVWPFSGFLPPVDPLPTGNVANAGSSIPVKFDLGGDRGLGILAPGYPASMQVACTGGTTEAPVEETATAGQSGLSFGNKQYVYVWKTDKAWAGTCRDLVVKLADGSVRRASFRFK